MRKKRPAGGGWDDRRSVDEMLSFITAISACRTAVPGMPRRKRGVRANANRNRPPRPSPPPRQSRMNDFHLPIAMHGRPFLYRARAQLKPLKLFHERVWMSLRDWMWE